MPRPQTHIFVCSHSREPGHPKGCCTDRGSQNVIMKFAHNIERHNLFGKVRVTRTGCLGACERGPVVVIYPDAVMYGPVSANDVDEIVEEHVIAGRAVNRLKVPTEVW